MSKGNPHILHSGLTEGINIPLWTSLWPHGEWHFRAQCCSHIQQAERVPGAYSLLAGAGWSEQSRVVVSWSEAQCEVSLLFVPNGSAFCWYLTGSHFWMLMNKIMWKLALGGGEMALLPPPPLFLTSCLKVCHSQWVSPPASLPPSFSLPGSSCDGTRPHRLQFYVFLFSVQYSILLKGVCCNSHGKLILVMTEGYFVEQISLMVCT